MTTKAESTEAPVRLPFVVDWRDVARAAIGSAFVAGLVGGALHVLSRMIEEESCAAETPSIEHDSPMANAIDDPEEDDTDDEREAAEAAALLSVRLDAEESEIRAALRKTIATSGAHPDHGGDANAAAKLIAARDLLIERARAVRS